VTDIFCVASAKGGAGKTTTAFALSCAAAHLGQRVLVIDLDSSRLLSTLLLSDLPALGILDVMVEPERLAEAAVEALPGIMVLLGASEMYESRLTPADLGPVVEAAGALADVVVIDTEPGRASLSAPMQLASRIVIPGQLDVLAMSGAAWTVGQALDLNLAKKVAGVLPTNVRRPMTVMARSIHDHLVGRGVALEPSMYSTTKWPAALGAGTLDGYPDLTRAAVEILAAARSAAPTKAALSAWHSDWRGLG
jgi:cellulose biosynthesis protein BcsQ